MKEEFDTPGPSNDSQQNKLKKRKLKFKEGIATYKYHFFHTCTLKTGEAIICNGEVQTFFHHYIPFINYYIFQLNRFLKTNFSY